jgi:hypothetical protein
MVNNESAADIENSSKRYLVKVDDNFHYLDESERYTLGSFGSAEEALAAAKGLVDEFLAREYKTGMTADELYSQYTSFGEDPFITSDIGKVDFSAWTYAKERCQSLCRTLLAGDDQVAETAQMNGAKEPDREDESYRPYERVGLFPFLPEERYIVDELEKLIRKLTAQANAWEIRDLSKLLFAVQRLPLKTLRINISLGIAARSEGCSDGYDIELSDETFRLGTSGFVSDGICGSDSYSQTLLELESSGFRNAGSDPFEIGGWFLKVYEAIGERGEIEIVDYGDDIEWEDVVDDIQDVWDEVRIRTHEERFE